MTDMDQEIADLRRQLRESDIRDLETIADMLQSATNSVDAQYTTRLVLETRRNVQRLLTNVRGRD